MTYYSPTSATTSTWGCWNYDNSTTATTTYTVWTSWNTSSGTTAITSSDTWYSWNGNGVSRQVVYEVPSSGEYAGLTKVERRTLKRRKRRQELTRKRRQLKRDRKAKAKYEFAKRERERAEKKAQELLEDLLGHDQMEIYRRTGRILVHGKKFDWLLSKDGKIKKIEQGKLVDLCVGVTEHSIPESDKVVTFLLHAKISDEYLNEEANRMRSYPIDEIPEAAVVNG